MAEKTEKPTPHKLRKLRKEGNVNKSEEFTLLIVTASSVEVMLMLVEKESARMEGLFSLAFAGINVSFVPAASLLAVALVKVACIFILPVATVTVLTRVAGNWLQFGLIFHPGAVTPDPGRLNPINQFKNLFSLSQLADFLITVTKFAVIIYLAWRTLLPKLGEFIWLAENPLAATPQILLTVLRELFRLFLLFLIVVALSDIALKRYFFFKKQAMSFEDIRREHKDIEGDPMMKSYQRSLSSETAQAPQTSPDIGVIPQQADVVINNASSTAVVLYLARDELPQIVFKQQGKETANLILQARGRGLPVISASRLSEILVRQEIGQFIPRDTLAEVARIYTQLQRLTSAR